MKNNQAIVEELSPDVSFEILSSDVDHLGYTCLLVPASPAQNLAESVQKSLFSSIQDMCVSQVWHLEFLTVTPQYVQWAVLMHPAVAPANLIRTARKETSRVIFNDFPHYKNEILKDDFWAPGHLVVFGIHPHLPHTVDSFIKLIRRQQGTL